MTERTSVPQPVKGAPHVETWIVDRSGSFMLWFRCNVCGDVTQKPCTNPQLRWGHWAQMYARMHPPVPHSR